MGGLKTFRKTPVLQLPLIRLWNKAARAFKYDITKTTIPYSKDKILNTVNLG